MDYVYDAGTDRVVSVSPAVSALLDAPVRDPGATAEARAAEQEIGEARDVLGLFRAQRLRLAPKRQGHERRGEYLDRLSQLTLTLDERCNLRCAYCPHTLAAPWTRPHGDRQMSEETVRSAVGLFLDRAGGETPSISLYGGEPLLASGLVRLVAQLVRDSRRSRVRVIVDTNGTLLDDAGVDLVAELGLHLQVSLDGPEAIHDRWRPTAGGGPTHARVLAGLRRLLDRDPAAAERLRFQATLAPGSDMMEADAFFGALGRELDLADISVGASYADLEGAEATALPPPGVLPAADDWARARAAYVEACASGRHADLGPLVRAWFDGPLIRFYHRDTRPLGDTFRPGGACAPGLRRLHVGCDGTLQPCERVGTAFGIGDVSRGFDFDAIDRIEREWFDALGGRCAGCWALRHCDLCFTAMIDKRSGRLGAVPLEACEAVCEGFEETLRLWVELLARSPRALDHLKGSRVS
ncbi:MAG: radical SAM protein [bacterium]|nr:radical SAM protein [bacterium]